MPGGLMRIVLTLATLVQNLDNDMRRNSKLLCLAYAWFPIADPSAPLYFHAWKVV